MPGERGIGGMAFTADGQLLVTGDDEGRLRYWSTRDGRLIRTLRAPFQQVCGVAVDGSRVAFSCYDRGWSRVYMTDLDGNSPREWLRQRGVIQRLQLHGDRLAAAATDELLVVERGRPLWRVKGCFSNMTLTGSALLANGFRDDHSTLQAWRLGPHAPKPLASIDDAWTFTLDQGGSFVVYLRENGLALLDLASGQVAPASPQAFQRVRPACRYGLTMEGGFLTLRNPDGRPAARVLLMEGPSGWECLTATPDGWFDGSPGADALVSWLDDGQAMPGTEASSRWRNPEKVREALARGQP